MNGRGFTLIELIIGITLLALVATGVIWGLSAGIRGVSRVETETIASQLAASQVEYIRAQPYTEPPNYELISPLPEGFSVSVSTNVLQSGYLQEITITVAFQGRTLLQLKTYKANPQPQAAASPSPSPTPTPSPSPTPTPPPPTIVTLNPTKDAYIDQRRKRSNYGSSIRLEVKSYKRRRENKRVFICFDLSSIPPRSTIRSATLRLYMYSPPASSRIYELHRVIEDWQENTITWENQPIVSAVASGTVNTGTKIGWLEWNVTSDVQDFINATLTNHGWRIKDAAEDSPIAYTAKFYSREFPTRVWRPKILKEPPLPIVNRKFPIRGWRPQLVVRYISSYATDSVSVPSPLSPGTGYYYAFSTNGTGEISAHWQIVTKMPYIYQRIRPARRYRFGFTRQIMLYIYQGTPFGSRRGSATIHPDSVRASIVASGSGKTKNLTVTSAPVPPGNYTVYFYNADVLQVFTKQATVSYRVR